MKVKIKINLPILIAEYTMCFIALLYSPMIVAIVFVAVCMLHAYTDNKALQSGEIKAGEIYPLKVTATTLITTSVGSAVRLTITSLVAIVYCLISRIDITIPDGVKSLALTIIVVLLIGLALMYKCAAKDVDKENNKK